MANSAEIIFGVPWGRTRVSLVGQIMSKMIIVSIGVACTVLLIFVCWFRVSPDPRRVTDRSTKASSSIAQSQALREIEAQRTKLDAGIWKQEVEAQRYESYFVQLWDRLRASAQPWDELAGAPLQSITIAELFPSKQIEHEIEFIDAHRGPTWTGSQWTDFVKQLSQRFRLVQSEWHHSRFELTDGGSQSTVSMALHVVDEQEEDRIVIKGDLSVEWPSDGTVIPKWIDASGLKAWRRRGPAQFRLAATLPASHRGATNFLAAYDLDGDGLSEICFGHQVFRNRGNGNFSAERLCRFRDAPLQSAVLADFNSDGRTDLLCADPRERPQLYLADNTGRFSNEPISVDAVEPLEDFSTSITAGDVNGDGFVDVWLTQYKPPYKQGQMPTPYYDANDGHPSYLLINDGRGKFTDETVARGLAAKRNRRTYSSSFVDLDSDGDLDLIVISDFAGLDVHRNDGNGFFRDITDAIVDEPNNFGMSHALADFDGDLELDLFVCGMGSTTARRLDAMRAGRLDRATETKMRSTMGYGNRLFLWKNRLVEPEYRDQVARTGWSWGVAELDFDNDGDRDIYVGNGHISGPTAKDYCSVFWRHDIYTGTSTVDPVLEQLFVSQQQEFQAKGSWNGFEHNCMLVNQSGLGFVEAAFLFGLAHEFDTRNIVADDIDGDGLVDLLIVDHPRDRPANLQVWKNQGPAGSWIGVVLPEQAGALLPGTKVVARCDTGNQVSHVVNGDSFNSQHASTIHFGLGDLDHVDSIEISRPGGETQFLKEPGIGKYHIVRSETLP